MTSAPLRAAATAADTPAEPPPITKTSVSALTGVERGSSSMKRLFSIMFCRQRIFSDLPHTTEPGNRRLKKPSPILPVSVSPIPAFSPHLFQQPQQRLLATLLTVPHGALFNHRVGHRWEFAFFGADLT